MRVVLDTNILISALISSAANPAFIYNAWQDGKFTLLSCVKHLDELRATLQKPRVADIIKPHKAGKIGKPNQKTGRGRRPVAARETISRSQRRFSARDV